jgi:tight adherence protein C
VTAWGAFLGALAAAGTLLVVARVQTLRRPSLQVRIMPFLRDLPTADPTVRQQVSAAAGVFGPVLRSAADVVERVLGGAASVRRRLERAGSTTTVHEFRIEQVLWGLGAFALAAAYGLIRTLGDSSDAASSALVCAGAFGVGILARDNRLSSQVKTRERRIVAEFPTVAELLALAVAAGEGPVLALDRVVRRSGGELSTELARVLAEVRTGRPVGVAFDALASRTGVPLVARFAAAVAIAVERGTPLADVLHAQAADVREAGRRELIEIAARKEVLMMVPVVFLVLPVTVLFAFYPGAIGLHLTTS